MFRSRLLLGFVAVAVIFVGGISGQDKKSGRLPPGWGKLGLIDKQKTAVYEIQAKYRVKVKELEQKIAELKKAEYDEMVGLLSDLQKNRLKELEGGNKKPAIKPKSDE